MRTMVIRMVEPTGYAGVRYVWISVPFIACLFDGKKYVSADNVPKPESRDLRRIRQGKVKAPRAPTLRSLVKLAVRCQSAEELGRKLRRRYQRQQQRRERPGVAAPR